MNANAKQWEQLAEEAIADAGRWKAEAQSLRAALEDAEFILRKLAVNPQISATGFADTVKRAANDCRETLTNAHSIQ